MKTLDISSCIMIFEMGDRIEPIYVDDNYKKLNSNQPFNPRDILNNINQNDIPYVFALLKKCALDGRPNSAYYRTKEGQYREGNIINLKVREGEAAKVLAVITDIDIPALDRVLDFEEQSSADKISELHSKLMLSENYNSKLQKNQEACRKYRHDNKSNLSTALSLLESGDIAGVKRHLENMLEDLRHNEDSINTGNLALNILLAEKIHMAEENDINCTKIISLPANISINYIDLLFAISMCLDYAIDGCNRITDASAEKYLMFKLVEQKGTIVFKMRTSAINTVVNVEELGKVKKIVDKYDGILKCEQHEDEFILGFTLLPRVIE